MIQRHFPEEVHHHVHAVAPVVSPAVSVIPTAAAVQDDGLRQDVRQVVDLMKNLTLNLMGSGQDQGRQYNQPTNNGGQGRNNSGQNGGVKLVLPLKKIRFSVFPRQRKMLFL